MGRFNNGIQGQFSGKIGGIVGVKVKGKQYGRSMPRVTKNAPTVGQMNQRKKFGLVMNWLRPVLNVINIGYQINSTGEKTPMNRAISYHIKNAISGNAPEFEIDFKNAVFTRGELLVSWILEVQFLTYNILKINWNDRHTFTFCSGDDRACFIFYNEQNKQYVTFEDAALRRDKTVSLQLPKNFSGGKAHGWMHYVSEEGNKVSTSIYLRVI